MARPTDADSAATYDSIVEATLSLLDEHGRVEAVSLRKVASRADVSLGTIQYYFENKDTLLEACLDGYYGRLTKLVNAMIRLKTNPDRMDDVALLEHAARELFRWGRRERGLLALRMSTNAQRGELHASRQSPFMGTLITEVAKNIADLITISEAEARIAIQLLAAMLTRAVLFTDAEVEVLTDASDEGRANIEEFFVATVRRVLRPGEG